MSERDVNICCETEEHVQREEAVSDTGDDDFAVAAGCAVDDLEEDDDFEDALDNLTFGSSRITDSNIAANGHDCLSDPDSLRPTQSDVNDEVLFDEFAADAADLSTSCEDDEVASEKQQEMSSSNAVVIDEDVLRQREGCLTDEEKQSRKEDAFRLKELGNKNFTSGCYEAAVVSYTDALSTCLLCHAVDRAIIYSNRAAAKMKLEQYEDAIVDCTKALEFNPDYMKALLRRAELYEKTDKLDEALEDYTKAVERDCSLHVARAACMRLPRQIEERNEKMKDEMIGKLKDLGNMILRPFGLSTNNFKMQQDPATGSYSVSFQQNADTEPPS